MSECNQLQKVMRGLYCFVRPSQSIWHLKLASLDSYRQRRPFTLVVIKIIAVSGTLSIGPNQYLPIDRTCVMLRHFRTLMSSTCSLRPKNTLFSKTMVGIHGIVMEGTSWSFASSAGTVEASETLSETSSESALIVVVKCGNKEATESNPPKMMFTSSWNYIQFIWS